MIKAQEIAETRQKDHSSDSDESACPAQRPVI
jgi:hypothetical protein